MTSLTRLDVNHNRIGDAGVAALRERAEALMKRRGGNPRLELSYADGNQLGWDETKKRRNALEERLLDALKRSDFKVMQEILGTPAAPTLTEALLIACASREVECGAVEWLIERGADVNGRGRLQRTPLHEAVDCGSEEKGDWNQRNIGPPAKLRLLVASGADLSATESHGLTPLAMARYLNKHTAVAMLS